MNDLYFLGYLTCLGYLMCNVADETTPGRTPKGGEWVPVTLFCAAMSLVWPLILAAYLRDLEKKK